MSKNSKPHAQDEHVAIVGMCGRFPGAKNLDQFWRNLRDGVESISFFSDEELRTAGVDAETMSTPGFVAAGAVLDDIDLFDATFFGFSGRDAEILDPQQRFLLECSLECLENGGYDPETFPGMIGLFAGCDQSKYLYNLYSNVERLGYADPFAWGIANEQDHLTTQVSYKLNLRGASIDVQTSCSTSLVAIAMACQSLLTYQSDLALAGGVAVSVPQRVGYFYQEGALLSPDGHCRPFDSRAKGTIAGSGIGMVLLKRLSEAIADGDLIHAVIRGSAVNNDGASKVGYTAPSVEGQAEVIALAQRLAGVKPEDIGYIEAHGTATPLGDPIEVAALTHAFREQTERKQFCGLGALKGNMGHLSSAAGVAGLLKTVLSLKHKELPPSLHYERPNPEIDFENSPFYVNTKLTPWESNEAPRRAGVSSFGIGGTNAHVIVEEAPPREPSGPSRRWQLLPLSAKTPSALDAATDNLARYLEEEPAKNLADVAYTLQVGRTAFKHRRLLTCEAFDAPQAARALKERDPPRVESRAIETTDSPVVFMFPGQGTQYVRMAAGLYQNEPTFRDVVDFCAKHLQDYLNFDLRQILYPRKRYRDEAARLLTQTSVTQPALFTVEYALACLWMDWGIVPQGLIGHSIGEYVAACVAEVFTVEDALALVATRGLLMEQMPAGSMLAVGLSEEDAGPHLTKGVSVAAVNAPASCVLSGPEKSIARIEAGLQQQGVFCRRLRTSHAFHSPMMDPVVDPLVEHARSFQRGAPQIPFISNVTGTWLSDEEATDPGYWGRHLRQTVRFADGLRQMLDEEGKVYLEVGPGQTLSALLQMQSAGADGESIISCLPSAKETKADEACIAVALGKLWLQGVQIDWRAYHEHERRLRVPLPTYPFERQRYWVGPAESSSNGQLPESADVAMDAAADRDIAEWLYVPTWKSSLPLDGQPATSSPGGDACWLVFSAGDALTSAVTERMTASGLDVVSVTADEHYAKRDQAHYSVRPGQRDDYHALLNDLVSGGRVPRRILHLWSVAESRESADDTAAFDRLQATGFLSLTHLGRAIEAQNLVDPIEVNVVTSQVHSVTGEESLCPAKATALGACKVWPQESPNVRCRQIDLDARAAAHAGQQLVEHLLSEVASPVSDTVVAYRQGRRWVQSYESLPLPKTETTHPRLRERGVYLITGGLGQIGLKLAEHLAGQVQAKLVLISRSGLPPREQWDELLASGRPFDTVLRIRRVKQLEQLGAEVLVLSADAGDVEQMRSVVEQAKQQFGAIHGVIHGAGFMTDDAVKPLSQTDAKSAGNHFRPKAHGAMILQKLLKDEKLDFCFLLSSLAGVLGGLGYAAYAAANIFLDALAASRNLDGSAPWISVNWDAWQFDSDAAAGTGFADHLLPHEGVDAFARILMKAPTQVVFCVGDFQGRYDQWINMQSVRQEAPGGRAAQYPRPNLGNEYVAARSDVEQQIADLWQQLLGVGPIGVDDNFFELGGHSLLGIQVVAKLREMFRMEIGVPKLFEAPTIAQLAAHVESELESSPDDESVLAELLKQVEDLSDVEVQELLAQQGLAD